MSLQYWVLTDNRPSTVSSELEIEHGLCLLLKTDQHTFLLDTGASDVFVRNAARLHLDLKEVDYVFLSHAHADHTGGLKAFLEINHRAKIIASPHVLDRSCFSTRRGGLRPIGIPLDLTPWMDRFVPVEDALRLDEAFFYACTSTQFASPLANRHLWMDSGQGREKDDFSHELVACFGTDDAFVFTGCAHKGLLNILDRYRDRLQHVPKWVVGGFHLLDSTNEDRYETDEELREIAREMNRTYSKTDFTTGHCTGDRSFSILTATFGNQIDLLEVGKHVVYEGRF